MGAIGILSPDFSRISRSKIALFIGRNLSERMQRQMRGLLHRLEGNEPNFVRLPDFLRRPTHRVSRASPMPPSGERSKAVMVGVMGRALRMRQNARVV